MEFLKNIYFQEIKNQKVGFIFFYIGIFLLPSAFVLASVSFLIASIYGSFYKKEKYFSDKWNVLLFISGSLMVINSFLQKFVFENSFKDFWDPNLTFLGLGNWLPFFWIFWTLQPYLEGDEKRKKTALILISGSLPVLISGFGVLFLNWDGPIQTLNGLITWYQATNYGKVFTGLFSNPNYAASWLLYIWPFCLALFLERPTTRIRKIISFSLIISVGLAIFLTNSRNAWAGLFTSLPILFGTQSLIWILPLYFIFGAIIFICVSNYLPQQLQNLIRSFVPDKVWMEFSKEGFKGLDASRLEVLISAIKISFFRPIFGIGAASFTAIYFFQTGIWRGHSHNLFFELAISYGIPSSILVFSVIVLLIIKSFKSIFISKSIPNQSNYFQKAWWASTFYFVISQLFDIQYFDGKISIVFWVLLAGIKNLYKEQKVIDNK